MLNLLNKFSPFAVLAALIGLLVAFQNCGGSPVNFQNSATMDSEAAKNVDKLCEEGLVGPEDMLYPDYSPLLPPELPPQCSNGFELNNLDHASYTIDSNNSSGSRAITLALDIATYRAPDDVRISAIDSSGIEKAIFHTCRMRSWENADPTDGTYRPPDTTIRQFKINLPAGTRSLRFDYSQVSTPTYLRIQGLCDFNLVAPVPSVGPRWRYLP